MGFVDFSEQFPLFSVISEQIRNRHGGHVPRAYKNL